MLLNKKVGSINLNQMGDGQMGHFKCLKLYQNLYKNISTDLNVDVHDVHASLSTGVS